MRYDYKLLTSLHKQHRYRGYEVNPLTTLLLPAHVTTKLRDFNKKVMWTIGGNCILILNEQIII